MGQNIYAGHSYLQEVIKVLKKRTKKLIKLISASLILTLIISSAGIYWQTFAKSKEKEIACIKEYENAAKIHNDDVSIYLVCGIDNAGWNSDVIMLVSVSKSLKKIGVLQIPRDTYINISGKNYHKINAIYSEGCRRAHNAGLEDGQVHSAGCQALSDFLRASMGVKIDGFASVTTSGLCKIVDSIGGVDLNIPTDLSYDDNSQDLHIRLKAGQNHLSGDLAVKFVRCRQYVNADYGRMSAQRMFLGAMFHKIKHDFSLKKSIELFKSAYNNVNTNIELSKALSLVRTGLSLSDGDINMENLFGKSVKVGSVYCEVLNREITSEKIKSCLYFQGLSDQAKEFDKNGVFNNPSDENINRIYTDKKYFMQ